MDSRGALWTGVASAVIVSIVFAPLITVGWCRDADETGTSVRDSTQRSLVGVETNGWLWPAALGVVVAVTLVIVMSMAQRR